jgi:hypothetical protein
LESDGARNVEFALRSHGLAKPITIVYMFMLTLFIKKHH